MTGFSLAIAISSISFLLSTIWGEPFIKLLTTFNIGKQIRDDQPATHRKKEDTPTMGGFMFLVPITLLTVILNAVSLFGSRLLGSSILVPLAALWAFSVIGAIDDWEGIRGSRRGLGMKANTKFILQVITGLALAYAIKEILQVPHLFWPASDAPLDFGWAYLPIATVIIVGMANAVNFTDGVDGLASIISMTAFGIYGIIGLMQGQVYLGRFCFCVVGALAGFLWFNCHPARLFMGDTGSQALGASLAVVALMTGRWLLLPLIAIIPMAELLSVIIQVAYFKITKGKRVFMRAPIHHHFEEIGWTESQIVIRFWIIELVSAMLGLSLTFIR
ncbi:MAG: phospho-N-acetylmuramoyl-pentapeptide-transferase [Chloroflexi bacterium]|nr:phospho-N-acetylmuramoyl-pentapeptide-transferase [Chloroflexota bacterium]